MELDTRHCPGLIHSIMFPDRCRLIHILFTPHRVHIHSTGAHAFSRARREQSKQAGARNQRLDLFHAPGTSHRHPRSSPSQFRTTGPVSVSPMPAVCHLTAHASASSHRPIHACRTQRAQERLNAREPRRKHCGGQRQTTAHTAADGAGRDSRRTHARPTCA